MNKAEKTKQFIIEKTAPIFNMKGYSGTSMQDITLATGLTKGSIYGNFKNKDEVALAVFQYNYEKMQTLFIQEISKKTTYREKLMSYPELYEKFATERFPLGGCPIMNTAIEADDTHPQLKALAKKAMLFWKDSLVRLINKGIEKNEFKSTTNADENALTIIALIEGAIMMINLTGKLDYHQSMMNTLRKVITAL
ncbi:MULTISPECIES: TetR/AcrR family transcriptional regulator [Flavobacterium]|uniref:TetR/AcrR family transcriptional regulator n=1 Tax=Flavobacterium TaxID=237 RepID=UPI00086A5AA2|nr:MULTISPECIES: TetR/AcrR family transcriptional regulator [Flavobacterium]MBN9282818.1 TetR/AcrR family transcriptional regulator [Flavobacterium sp.]ODS84029.1 MAG: transcriptional regulator [Chryseobacterium sp. SCN 40-13]OJV72348.1 MAG: TetR family transcriptional regulator [Flavobacterium sp. 40-81]